MFIYFIGFVLLHKNGLFMFVGINHICVQLMIGVMVCSFKLFIRKSFVIGYGTIKLEIRDFMCMCEEKQFRKYEVVLIDLLLPGIALFVLK